MDKEQVQETLRTFSVEREQILTALKAYAIEYERDRNELYESAYPGATQYDRDRVQRSVTSGDDKYASIIQSIMYRESLYNRETHALDERLKKLERFISVVRKLEPELSTVITALYLPRHSQREAAKQLGVSVKTINRHHAAAISRITYMTKIYGIE